MFLFKVGCIISTKYLDVPYGTVPIVDTTIVDTICSHRVVFFQFMSFYNPIKSWWYCIGWKNFVICLIIKLPIIVNVPIFSLILLIASCSSMMTNPDLLSNGYTFKFVIFFISLIAFICPIVKLFRCFLFMSFDSI